MYCEYPFIGFIQLEVKWLNTLQNCRIFILPSSLRQTSKLRPSHLQHGPPHLLGLFGILKIFLVQNPCLRMLHCVRVEIVENGNYAIYSLVNFIQVFTADIVYLFISLILSIFVDVSIFLAFLFPPCQSCLYICMYVCKYLIFIWKFTLSLS